MYWYIESPSIASLQCPKCCQAPVQAQVLVFVHFWSFSIIQIHLLFIFQLSHPWPGNDLTGLWRTHLHRDRRSEKFEAKPELDNSLKCTMGPAGHNSPTDISSFLRCPHRKLRSQSWSVLSGVLLILPAHYTLQYTGHGTISALQVSQQILRCSERS